MDREPGVCVFGRQVSRTLRRGLGRPIKSTFLTLLLVCAVIGLVVLKEQRIAPRYVLRATEADRDTHTAPRPKRHLREHVMNAVFTSSRLLELMERNHLYPGLRKQNPQAALESFREDIDIDVYRNYFLEDRHTFGPPRSARIMVRYFSADPKVATAVTGELARMIVEHEAMMRRSQAQQAAATASNLVVKARERLYSIQRTLVERELEVDVDRVNWVEVAALRRWAKSMEILVESAERRKAALDIGAVVEARNFGLTFEVVDEGAVPRSAFIEPADLIRIGSITFLFAFPLLLLLVGSFDSTVRTLQDIERIGFVPLGKLNLTGGKT
jgi:hypothetical protein